MTNEKTNPLPYRAAAEPGLPDMSEPVITPDDVARGTELLRRYKDGKRALEARIIADEQWYRLRHWQYLRDRRRERKRPRHGRWLLPARAVPGRV